mmetsp:Transcript_35022/g.83048  ORF Transcript_35022/g.83048 Transcript_35022/m.83048 type:complete len:257 (-) Transcript_35022:142-912(-)
MTLSVAASEADKSYSSFLPEALRQGGAQQRLPLSPCRAAPLLSAVARSRPRPALSYLGLDRTLPHPLEDDIVQHPCGLPVGHESFEPRMLERAPCRYPLTLVLVQEPAHEAVDLGRKIVPNLRGVLDLVGDHTLHDILRRQVYKVLLVPEGKRSREHQVHHNAGAPAVGLDAVPLAEDLRREEDRGAHPDLQRDSVQDPLAAAEVDGLHVHCGIRPIGIEQHEVAWLDVSKADTLLMAGLEELENGLHAARSLSLC